MSDDGSLLGQVADMWAADNYRMAKEASPMNDRDQLADLINDDVNRQVEVHASYISHFDQHELADAVIAAGWRPPPQRIETAAELQALPEYSVVRWTSPNGLSRGIIERFDRSWWQPGNHVRLDLSKIPLPAELLWTPGGEA